MSEFKMYASVAGLAVVVGVVVINRSKATLNTLTRQWIME